MSPPDLSRRHLLAMGAATPFASLLHAPRADAGPFGHARAPAPRSIIVMVSDGMSPSVPLMAESFSRLTRGIGTHWCRLSQERSTVHGLFDMASADSPVTDSAAASSAWSTGVRVPNGSINVTADGTELHPIGRRVRETGRALGLVTTTRVTHATPAAFYARARRRQDEDAIALQAIDHVDVLLGGGGRHFSAAHRADGADVIAQLKAGGCAVIRTRTDLPRWRLPRRLVGLFGDDHLPYDIDRGSDSEIDRNLPTLAEMTGTALAMLRRHRRGFLLQIEGGRIDHAAHANDIAGLLHEQLAFDDALGIVLDFIRVHPRTLLIVTTDHGCANPGLNGIGSRYHRSGEHFAGIAQLRGSLERAAERAVAARRAGTLDDQALRAIISDVTPHEFPDDHHDRLLRALSGDQSLDTNAQQRCFVSQFGQILGNVVGVQWTGVTHTADPALVMATGPGAEALHGFRPGTDLHGVMEEWLRVGAR